jgi:hypothetical protein
LIDGFRQKHQHKVLYTSLKGRLLRLITAVGQPMFDRSLAWPDSARIKKKN